MGGWVFFNWFGRRALATQDGMRAGVVAQQPSTARVAQWKFNSTRGGPPWTAGRPGALSTSHNADARLCFATQTRDCPGTCWKGPESKRYLPRHYRHCVQRPFQPSTIAPLGAIRPFFLRTVPGLHPSARALAGVLFASCTDPRNNAQLVYLAAQGRINACAPHMLRIWTAPRSSLPRPLIPACPLRARRCKQKKKD